MKTRLKTYHELSENTQSQFYSSWKYQAIQTLISIKKLQNPEILANSLSLPLNEVLSILEFLVNHQLAERDGNEFKIGVKNIHLSDDSNFLRQHHINWRLKAMDSLDIKKNSNDLHYSAAITMNKEDALKMRKTLLDQLSENLKFIESSNEESGHVLCLDFFSLNH